MTPMPNQRPKRKKLRSNSTELRHTQTFSDHLSELKSRLISIFIFFAIGSVLGYTLRQRILSILIKPLDQTLFYSSPAGGFEFTLQIALFFGLLVSLPVLVFQTIKFIEPALPSKAPQFLIKIILASTTLLLIGIAFAFFVSLPAALYFLSKFSGEEIQPLISTSEYFNFVTRYLLGFGLIFQLPVVLLAINSFQKIKVRTLFNNERYVVLGSAVFAGILTPTPDILNQLNMALPLVLLYQLSMLLIWLINSKKLTI